MDDALGLIIGLIVLAFIIAAIVFPIVALIVSVQTRKKLNQAISRTKPTVGASEVSESSNISSVLQQLTLRVARLEAAMSARPLMPTQATEEASVRASEPPKAPTGRMPPPPTSAVSS